MKIDKCAEFILEKLNENGYEAYVVGGCVRDSLLGRDINDWDICTSATPDQTYKLFGDLGLTVIDTGMKYGTTSVLMNLYDIDTVNGTHLYDNTYDELRVYEVTTFRKDSGPRKPDNVEWTKSLKEDLLRRDFTMNALAYNPKTGIIDICGGIQDIENKIIRCIQNPHERLNEDYLRVLRAIRFKSQLGFEIEAETYKCAVENAKNLREASSERLLSELFKFMSGDYVVDALLSAQDIVAELIPELRSSMNFDQNNPNHIYTVYKHSVETLRVLVNTGQSDPLLRLAALLHDIGKPATCTKGNDSYYHFNNHAEVGALLAQNIMKRFNASNADCKMVYNLVKYHDIHFDTKSGIRRLMGKVGVSTTYKILMLRHADILAQSTYNIDSKIENYKKMYNWFIEIRNSEDALKLADLEISGDDLIMMGYIPGKLFGIILNDVFSLVIEDKLENKRSKLLEYVENTYPLED